MIRKALLVAALGALALAGSGPVRSAVATTSVTVTGADPYYINYVLAQQASTLVIKIYSASGTLVQTLDLSYDYSATTPGRHDASGLPNPAPTWDGYKSDGNPAPRGTYYAEVITTGEPTTAMTQLGVAYASHPPAPITEARPVYSGDVNRKLDSPFHNTAYFGIASTNTSGYGCSGFIAVDADATNRFFQQDGAAGTYDYVAASVLTDDTILLGGQGKKKVRNVKATDGSLIADYAAGKVDVRGARAFGAGANARYYFVDDQTPNGPLTGSIVLLNPISNNVGTPIYQTIVTQAQIDTAAGLVTTTVPGTRDVTVNRAETALWLVGYQGGSTTATSHFIQKYKKVGSAWELDTAFNVPVGTVTTGVLRGCALTPNEQILWVTNAHPSTASLNRIFAVNANTGEPLGSDYEFYVNVPPAPNTTFTPQAITCSASDINNPNSTSYNIYVTGFRTVLAAVTTGNSVAVIAPVDNGSADKTRSDFFDVVLGATSVGITAGPSVSNITESTATVTWDTDFRSSTVVHLGTAAGEYTLPDRSVIGVTTHHVVDIANLVPGTTYYYQVESAKDPLTPATATGTFTTKPDIVILSETMDAQQTTATLKLTTNVDASALVHWGTAPASFDKPDINVASVATSPIVFTGLSGGTTYYYQIELTSPTANPLTTTVCAFATGAAGGTAGTLNYNDFRQAHRVNLTAAGGGIALPNQGLPGPVYSGTALNTAVYDAGVVAYNGYLYCIGGSDASASALSDVSFIKIMADGSLDPNGWVFATNALPLPRTNISNMAVAYNGFLYVVGGRQPGAATVPQTSVLYAPINPTTGDVGIWQGLDGEGAPINPLPVPRYNGSAVVMDGNLLVSGGSSGGAGQATNFIARFKPDGSIGPWAQIGNLNEGRWQHRTNVNHHKVYAVGGENSSYDRIYTTDIAGVMPGGDLARFIRATQYDGHTDSIFEGSTPHWSCAETLVAGKLVTAGGRRIDIGTGNINGSTRIAVAKILPDGIPGVWRDAATLDSAAILPANVADLDGAAWENFIYVVGGRGVSVYGSGQGTNPEATAVTDVTIIPMVPDFEDNGYATAGTVESKIYDLGAVTNLKHLTVAGTLVNASSVDVRYRYANADGVFTNYYKLNGVDADINGGARYFQFLLVLKGDGSATPVVTSVTLTTAVGAAAPLSVEDTKKALAIAAGLIQAQTADMTRLNVDGVGGITTIDAVKIQRTVSGL